MAKEKAAAERPPHGETRTFTLTRPVVDDAGKEYATITIAEPELHHQVQVERKKTAGESEITAALIGLLSGLPDAAVRRLKLRDVIAIKTWLDGVISSGVKADLAREAAAPLSLDEPERPFELLVPVALSDGVLTRITVREPDLEAGIAVERFALPSEQTAALIATCSGQIIPNVMRMKVRDVRRIERWFDFLLQPGAAQPPEPEAVSASRANGVGATSP